jgi:2-oxo-4-hydroxy-4-carboxy-5-ureidoimidazoline decarboxylase
MIDLPDSQLREALTTSLAVDRWVDEVAAAAPFESLDALLAIAESAATPLSHSEIEQAIAHHPRIGEKPVGDGASQRLSRLEQSSPDDSDDAINVRIAEGNSAYERLFNRVFLIRAAGRSRAEILAELNRRLVLGDDEELDIVGEQLREIALLRLRSLLGEVAA